MASTTSKLIFSSSNSMKILNTPIVRNFNRTVEHSRSFLTSFSSQSPPTSPGTQPGSNERDSQAHRRSFEPPPNPPGDFFFFFFFFFLHAPPPPPPLGPPPTPRGVFFFFFFFFKSRAHIQIGEIYLPGIYLTIVMNWGGIYFLGESLVVVLHGVSEAPNLKSHQPRASHHLFME